MNEMYIVASFEHSDFLELAMAQLEEKWLRKEDMVAVPLDEKKIPIKIFDTIHHSDGVSLLDLAAVFGTIFSVIFASYGFVLTWGPIIWGLIGLGIGAVIGFIFDFFFMKRKMKREAKLLTEVVLIIKCPESQFDIVKEILFEHKAFGVGKMK